MADWHDTPPAYEEAVHASLQEQSGGAPSVPSDQAPALPARPSSSSTWTPSSGIGSPALPPRPSPQPGPGSEPPVRPLGPLPTTHPTPGHPLLNGGKLLVFPRNQIRCEKCGNTGYKASDPSRPCSRCWRKYGRSYKGALKQAYEGSPSLASVLQDVSVQRPLHGPVSYTHPTFAHGAYPLGYVSQPTYTLAPHASQQHCAAYAPSASGFPQQSYWPPAPEPSTHEPERFPEDQHTSAPPRYDHASMSEKPLPDQQYPHPQPMPQPARPPQPYPPQPYPPRPPWGHTAPAIGPTYNWYLATPPPGAVSVQPGDPRIGGVLCPECGGSGDGNVFFNLFLGDDECGRCGGTGRVGHGPYV